MNGKRIASGWLLALGLAAVASAQRVQFPSAISQPPASSAPSYSAPSYSAPPSMAPTYSPPAYSAPMQPAPSAWDPYADPALGPQGLYSPAPSPYYTPPQQPAQPSGTTMFPPGYPQEGSFWGRTMRLVQETRVQDTWVIGGSSGDDLGVNTLELSSTLAFPFFYNQAPLLVTPGAAVNWFDGPSPDDADGADLPPRTYDVFVDTAWNPQITERVHTELGIRVGAYTDFDAVNSDSLRIMWRALLGITYSPTLQIKGGVIYIDRNNTGLLPAGGVIYTPNPDTRYEIIFPRPKLAQRLTTIGNTALWGYIAGEYGGGSWTIEREAGFEDSVDYNDLRAILGLEWIPETSSGRRGHLEIGYVFSRELEYEVGPPDSFEPDDTFMIRAGMSF